MRAVDLVNAGVPLAGLALARDVPYGPRPRQRMDLYRPERAAGPLPMLVWLYGGAWRFGRRQDYRFAAAALARAGFVVAVPDYRLFPDAPFPAAIADAALAVAVLRDRAAEWGGDPARLVVAGHSAGAHSAAMLALAPHYLRAVGLSPADLAGAAGIGGPYDFLPILDPDVIEVFASAADPRETQPIAHVDGCNPPVLLLHGLADRVCYPRNALALAARIRAAGGDVMLRTYPGVGHIGIVLGFIPWLRWMSPVLADLTGFAGGVLAAGTKSAMDKVA